jgi:hypothetical protein
MSEAIVGRRCGYVAEGRLCRPGGQLRFWRVATEKEGVRGGTMGSPTSDVRFLDV